MPGPSDTVRSEMGRGGRWRPSCQDGPATPCERRRGPRHDEYASARGILLNENHFKIQYYVQYLKQLLNV